MMLSLALKLCMRDTCLVTAWCTRDIDPPEPLLLDLHRPYLTFRGDVEKGGVLTP